MVAEITAFYKDVSSPEVVTSSVTILPNITRYKMTVLLNGLSEKSQKPVASYKEVGFCVFKEGDGTNEEAYYSEELCNEMDLNITGTDCLSTVYKIFNSSELRKRTQSAMAKTALSILNEPYPSSLLIVDSTKNQKAVIVSNSSIFWSGKSVVIKDTQKSENNTIDYIDSTTIWMTTDLKNDYTVEDNAIVIFTNNQERMKWSIYALMAPEQSVLPMSFLLATDSTVQSVGGLISDSSVQAIVNNNVNNIAQSYNYL